MGDFDEWVYDHRSATKDDDRTQGESRSHTSLCGVSRERRKRRTCMPRRTKKVQTFSLQLGVAVKKVTKRSDLGVKLAVARKQEQEKGKTLSGFFAYHMLLKQYKFTANSKSCLDMKRLQSLRCQNDRDIVRFLADWDTTRMKMLEQPSEYLLTRLFWDQVKNC
eukprot:6424276-Amphidinium_carterae.1